MTDKITSLRLLFQAVQDQQATIDALLLRVIEQDARIKALEAADSSMPIRRGPGRPPKDIHA